MRYDIIGDVHGQASKLESLLSNMGYQERSGAWGHADSRAIFVGDFIDRGPRQMDAIRIVRSMVEEGSALAIMGNHELNAIGWATPSRRKPGDWLRTRQGRKGADNLGQHQAFLDQIGEGSSAHADLLGWFMGLPLWIDLPELRVVHACWHPGAIGALNALLGGSKTLDPTRLSEALEAPGEPGGGVGGSVGMGLFEAVELVCKGVEIAIPGGGVFVDAAGYERSRARARWWDRGARTFKACAMLPEGAMRDMPDGPIPASCVVEAPTDKPLFFGHYWMTGAPEPLGERLACVDYSAGKEGPLIAYRYRGEERLTADNFASSDRRARRP